MNLGMPLLLDLLRGQPVAAIQEEELESLLTLAEDERVLPFVLAQLEPDRMPPQLSDSIRTGQHAAVLAAFFWSSSLKDVLRGFAGTGIAVVPLKGPSLAQRLYGDTTLRTIHDLDLLVSASDLTQAERLLSTIGFLSGSPDDYHRQWHRGTALVELHHDVENPLAFNFHVGTALARARPATFQGQPCLLLAPEDELLYLCLHAVRHRFERLSLILDLKLAFEKLAPPAHPWQPRPQAAALDPLITLGLAMARHLQPDLTIPLPLHTSPAQTQHLNRLADSLWHDLLTRPREPLDWRTLHAFYLQLELPGLPRLRVRLRHLRILATRTIQPDYAFAARFGLHRPWQVRLLRPLRVLSQSLGAHTPQK